METTTQQTLFPTALPAVGPTNDELAEVLVQMADLLTRLDEPNPYRVQAYLLAADTLRAHPQPVAAIYGRGGRKALMELSGVGTNIAGHLAQYVERGRVGLGDRLRAAADPAALLASVPGIGEALGRRIVDELGIGTLAELERAAHDGRLAQLEGFGPRRIEAIRLQLNSILNRAARRRARRVRRQLVQLAAVRWDVEDAREEAELERGVVPGGATVHPMPERTFDADEEARAPATIHVLHGPPAAA